MIAEKMNVDISDEIKISFSAKYMIDALKTIKSDEVILTFVGEGIIVIITVVMGIKYVFASPDEQAKLKKQLVGLVISAIVIFGAYGIWSLAYSFMNDVLGQ